MNNPKKGDKYIYIGGNTHPQWLGEVFTIDRVEGEDIFFLERRAHTFKRDLGSSFLLESAVEVGKSYICCKKGHSQYGNTVKIRQYDGRVVEFEKANGDIAGTIYIEKFHRFLLPEVFSIDVRPYSKEEVDALFDVAESLGFNRLSYVDEFKFVSFYKDRSVSGIDFPFGKQLVCISRLIDINPWIKNTGVDPKLDYCEVKFVGGRLSANGAEPSLGWFWGLGSTTDNIEYYREVQQGKPKLEVGDTVYSDRNCVENKNPYREMGLDLEEFNSINAWKSLELEEVSMVSVPTDRDIEFMAPNKSLLSRIWNNKLVQDWIG